MTDDLMEDIRGSQLTIMLAGLMLMLSVVCCGFYVTDNLGWQPGIISGFIGVGFAFWTDFKNVRIRRRHEQRLYR